MVNAFTIILPQFALMLALAAAALARPDYSNNPSESGYSYDDPSESGYSYDAPTHPSSSYRSPSRTSRPSHPSASYNEPTQVRVPITLLFLKSAAQLHHSCRCCVTIRTNPPSFLPQGPAQYDTQYIVSDEESGNNFGQQETRDGDIVSGTYYVQLPDGRLQVVTYTVSAETGYVAEVTYEGTTTTASPTSAAPASSYGTPSSLYSAPS